MRELMMDSALRFRPWSSAAICSVVASGFLGATAVQGVPIDLTDSTPTVTGESTLHIDGILTLGATYWADFEWNDRTNKFDVTAYGEGDASPEGFALVRGGTFTMGSPQDEPGRSSWEIQHEVTLTRDFYMGETEVSQAQWVSVMGSNPSWAECDECPVDGVTWYDAVDYCNVLSTQEGLEPAYEVDGTSVSWA